MAWQLRTVAALPEDLGLSPGTYTVSRSICNSDSRGSNAFIWAPHVVRT